MIIFGMNLPLPELFFLLVVLFFIFLLMILFQLQRLQRMTTEEKDELAELEKLAQDEKADLEQIKSHESVQLVDLGKFEKEIMDLEEDTETLYLKKLAPELYKVQNYVLWALEKGQSPEQIRTSLLSKGWKDTKMVDMVITDMLKYKGYYVENKPKAVIPEIKEPAKIVEKESPKVPEQPIIIRHKTSVIKTKTVNTKKTTKRSKSKSKALKKPKVKKTKPAKTAKQKNQKKGSDDFSDVEKELTRLEKNLASEGKKKLKEEKPKSSGGDKKTPQATKEKKSDLKKSGLKKPGQKQKEPKPASSKTAKPDKKKPKVSKLPKITSSMAKAAKPGAEKADKAMNTDKPSDTADAKSGDPNNRQSATVILEAGKDVDVHVKYK